MTYEHLYLLKVQSPNLTKTMNTSDAVINALKSSPVAMKAGEISEKTGIDKKDVDKAIKILVDKNIISSPKRCYYEFKK